MDFTGQEYPSLECEYLDSIWCGQYGIPNLVNIGLLTILVIGLVLISFLIYRKHKGEKGLWKKILKRDLIYFFIIFVLWIIFLLIVWLIGPVCSVCTIGK